MRRKYISLANVRAREHRAVAPLFTYIKSVTIFVILRKVCRLCNVRQFSLSKRDFRPTGPSRLGLTKNLLWFLTFEEQFSILYCKTIFGELKGIRASYLFSSDPSGPLIHTLFLRIESKVYFAKVFKGFGHSALTQVKGSEFSLQARYIKKTICLLDLGLTGMLHGYFS